MDVATAPDGTVYIVDPYRGIIQEGNWTRPGSYLRAKIDQYKLASNIRRGRIWRVSYEGMARDATPPRLLTRPRRSWSAGWRIANGWWRDTAQQLLVLKQDKSVVPALQQMVRTSNNLFGRIHALVDAGGAERARSRSGPRAVEGSESADAHPGDSRQRDALQERASVRCSTTIARPRRIRTPT